MRWHSLLPDRLGVALFRALNRWNRHRYGEPPVCGADGCSAEAGWAFGHYDPEYRCLGCAYLGRKPGGALEVRPVTPKEDYGRGPP